QNLGARHALKILTGKLRLLIRRRVRMTRRQLRVRPSRNLGRRLSGDLGSEQSSPLLDLLLRAVSQQRDQLLGETIGNGGLKTSLLRHRPLRLLSRTLGGLLRLFKLGLLSVLIFLKLGGKLIALSLHLGKLSSQILEKPSRPVRVEILRGPRSLPPSGLRVLANLLRAARRRDGGGFLLSSDFLLRQFGIPPGDITHATLTHAQVKGWQLLAQCPAECVDRILAGLASGRRHPQRVKLAHVGRHLVSLNVKDGLRLA